MRAYEINGQPWRVDVVTPDGSRAQTVITANNEQQARELAKKYYRGKNLRVKVVAVEPEPLTEDSVADQIRADIKQLGGNINDYYVRFTDQDKLGYSSRQTFGRTPDVDDPRFDLEYIGAGQGRPALWFYPAAYYLKNKDLYASGQPYAWLVRLKPTAWLQSVDRNTRTVEPAPEGKQRVGIVRQSSVPAAIFFRPGFELVGRYYDYAGQHQRHGKVKGAPKKPGLWDRFKKALTEINAEDELSVSQQIQDYFTSRGYKYLGEGRDQIAFESPRGTVVKVLGIGDDEREQVVRDYVAYFVANQKNPYYPRIYNTGEFTLNGETYFVYEMEYLQYVANEEQTLDFLETLMWKLSTGDVEEFLNKNLIPAELTDAEVYGLIETTENLLKYLGKTINAPLDLHNVENLRRRANGHLVITDPFSL